MRTEDAGCGCRSECETMHGTAVYVHEMPAALSLSHHYPLPALDATSIPVYRGPIEHGGNAYQRGLISIELQPRPLLRAFGVSPITGLDDVPHRFGGSGTEPVRVIKEPARWIDAAVLRVPTETLPAAAKTARKPRAKATGRVERAFGLLKPIEVGNPDNLDCVTFFLINGWYAEDGRNTCYKGQERHGQLEVSLGDWQLRIEPRGDHSQKNVQGYQRATDSSTVTHIGRLRRDDGDLFAAAEAMPVLEVVQRMTDFAMGRVTAMILPVGWQNEAPTWATWHCNRAVDHPAGSTPFLDKSITATQLEELFRRGY